MAPLSIIKKVDECIGGIQVQESHPERRAYCCLLYGMNPSKQLVANCIAMASSLRDSAYPLVLMVTPDVPEAIKLMLTSTLLFHRIQQVSNIRAHISLFKKDWFRDVFTKLHIFNMTEYDKVIFLDLDIIVHHADIMDSLFDLPCMYGAMENSKGKKASSNWLKHGQRMDRYCGLINAGVIIVTPHADLFQIFLEDVTFESQEHEPGMTPEQCYLARVMGRHFVHISQLYNFEVQFHGGVPVTPIWTSAKDQDIVCFHFSGASPLRMLGIEYNVETGALSLRKSGHTPTEWGCQTDKFFVGKSWDENFDPIVRSFANQRAEYAFNLWETNLRYGLSRCAHITKPRRICPVLDRMFRGFTRRLAAAGESTAPAITASAEKVIVKKCSMVSRFRSFFSGAVFASAVGMYIITFQLQGLLDEVKSAVYDVSVRQQLLESKIAKLETPSSAPTE